MLSSYLRIYPWRRNIFSDIKPDNILLDAQGHAHITDFNVAIHYSERRLHNSVAGSMAYMAPEVIGRRGYTWCIDWWSLGVTAYELLFSYRPFDGRTAEKMRKSITNDNIKFPDDVSRKCSSQGIDFIRRVSARHFMLYGQSRDVVCSSLNVMSVNASAANPEARASRTSKIIHGCRE